MKFGSVCSGIEAASVAWNPLGWEAAWLSEIEPFPSAVLKHHYPDVPNLGDMTALPDRILSGEVEAPDLFCGGTPCQAFSVAGLRNSLDDARGNLSLTFVGIANAIDHVRSVRGDSPAIIFWENVPGVLSTKDNAFGCFLGALAGEDDPIVPPGEKWTNAGCVYGPQRTVAWRVLDAQYFGVAQRRRRVFVVASAREGFDPAEVLFEFNGVRRDTAPSREARESTTAGVIPRVAGSLDTQCGGQKLTHQSLANGHVIGTITARMFNSLGARDVEEGALLPVSVQDQHITQPIAFSRNDDGRDATTNLSPTMRVAGRAGGMLGVAQPIPIDMRNAGRDPEKHDEMNRQGVGVGDSGDPAHTVTSAFVHAVAQPIGLDEEQNAMIDCFGTLKARTKGGGFEGSVAQPIAFHPTQDPITSTNGTTHGLGCGSNDGQASIAVAFGFDAYNHTIQGQVNQPLRVSSAPGQVDAVGGIVQGMAVRRLTPIECERLQGFPDNYTEIPWRKKPADQCPDGPRYKALGNSWAVPVVHWIGKRIQAQLEK